MRLTCADSRISTPPCTRALPGCCCRETAVQKSSIWGQRKRTCSTSGKSTASRSDSTCGRDLLHGGDGDHGALQCTAGRSLVLRECSRERVPRHLGGEIFSAWRGCAFPYGRELQLARALSVLHARERWACTVVSPSGYKLGPLLGKDRCEAHCRGSPVCRHAGASTATGSINAHAQAVASSSVYLSLCPA